MFIFFQHSQFCQKWPKIATSKLRMQPEIKFWQPKFLNWLPTAGYLPFSLDVFTLQQDQEDTVHQYIVHQFTVP